MARVQRLDDPLSRLLSRGPTLDERLDEKISKSFPSFRLGICEFPLSKEIVATEDCSLARKNWDEYLELVENPYVE